MREPYDDPHFWGFLAAMAVVGFGVSVYAGFWGLCVCFSILFFAMATEAFHAYRKGR